MNLKVKLVALFLVISLVPLSVVGYTATNSMADMNRHAQTQSASQLRDQMTEELNGSVQARQQELQNQIDGREVDVRALAESSAMNNYLAARRGEMKLVQQSSQKQLGYMALQMRAAVRNAHVTVMEREYGDAEWEDLSPAEKRHVENEVEKLIAGTSGDGTAAGGTMHDAFQPGYIGDTGYAYVVDSDSNVVVHHSLEDGFNLVEDAGGTLTVFEDIEATVESSPAVRNGEEWGVAEYRWEDTTQDGNPKELKFIAYAYYEPFDWVLSPSVYYYELQETATRDAKENLASSFERNLQTRTVSVDDGEFEAYQRILLTNAAGNEILHTHRDDDGEIVTESHSGKSYAHTAWYREAKARSQGETFFGRIRTDDGEERLFISTPVYNNGAFEGVLAVQFNYSIITTITNRVTVGDNGYLYVINDRGRIVSHPDESLVDERVDVAAGEYGDGLAGLAERQMLAGETGLATHTRATNGTNTTRYVAFAPLYVGDRQFTLAATVPERDIDDPIAALGAELQTRSSSARDLIFLLAGGAALAVALAGYLAARYVSKPIAGIKDHAEAMSRGQFDDEVDIDTGDDEIGAMVDAFEEMQTNLNRQVDELETVSRRLKSGDLDGDVRTDLPGKFGAIMEDLQSGVEQLDRSFRQIRRASRNVRRGELDQHLETDLPGDYGDVMSELDTGLAQLSESFDQLSAASDELRDRRLNQQLDTDLPGAYGDVMASLDEGLAAVDESIARVQSIARRVDEVSDEVAASTEEIETASEEVAQSAQEISHGTEQQAENLQETVSEMNDLSATVEEIASSADVVVDTVREATERAEVGRDQAAEATGEIQQIERETEEAVSQVGDLQSEMEEIGEIVQMITNIAEQTNLLALNASIEAARAGEAGEGFAVVADEIKSLANEAGDAAEEVSSLIAEIQSTTGETVSDMEQMRDRVDSSADTIEEAIGRFDDVAVAVSEAEDGIQEISDATDDQATSTEEVVSMVDEVSSVSEETAAEASNVSAASEEQTTSLNTVADNVQEVAALAEDLNSLVDEFEVREATATPAVSGGGQPAVSDD
jgi:methyl-accepting chemotaxis protein